MVEIITIEKSELIRLIDTSVAGAIEKAIHSSQPSEIMTKAEVAKYLKKSSATINRWMRENGLPFYGVDRPTFNRTEVDAWLANSLRINKRTEKIRANIVLIGNLGKEPETVITDDRTFMTKFSIASNTFRSTSDGRVEKVDWFRVTALANKLKPSHVMFAKDIGATFREGLLLILGWTEMKRRSGAEITLLECRFLTEKHDDDGGEDAAAVVPQQMYAPAEIPQTATY